MLLFGAALPLPPPPLAPPPRSLTEYPTTLEDSRSLPPAAPPLSSLTSGPRGARVEACARRCLPGCLRGGAGSPDLGPLTLRKDPVVFKSGFRSRGYCLSECTRVCAAVDATQKP